MIYYYFSQPIYVSDFDSSLIELKYTTNRKWESNTITSFGTQNELSLKSHTILVNELFKYTEQVVTEKHKIDLFEIWANEYMEKDFQEQHTHPDSHFSFTIMHKIPKGSGCLKFYNPYGDLAHNHKNFKFIEEPSQKENTIIIWPSYIKHMVTPGSNKTKRITYSGNFNIIL